MKQALIAICLLSVSGCFETCGSLTKRLNQAHITVAGMRQAAKEYYSDKCKKVAKTCPTRLTGEPAEKCPELMACWKQMDEVFAGTTSAQLAIYTALGLKQMGKDEEAESLFVKIGVAILDLKDKLTKYGVLPGGS